MPVENIKELKEALIKSNRLYLLDTILDYYKNIMSAIDVFIYSIKIPAEFDDIGSKRYSKIIINRIIGSGNHGWVCFKIDKDTNILTAVSPPKNTPIEALDTIEI